MRTLRLVKRSWLLVMSGMLLGMTSASEGATRFVAQGTCLNHPTAVGTSFESCAASKEARCTAAQPCCTIQDAADAATDEGDVIEIHEGTYADPTGFIDDIGSYAFIGARFAVRLNTDGITVRKAAGDAPTLNLGTKNHMGILIAKSRITVEGLRIIGGIGGQDTARVADILASGESGTRLTDVTVRNNSLEVGTANHIGSVSGNMCIKLDNTSGFLVEANTCSGGWDFSIWVYAADGSGGGIVRRNVQIGNGRGGTGSQRGMVFELLGSRNDNGVLLIYNNTLTQAPTAGMTFGLYLREIHWATYVFNNVFAGVDATGVYFQDDLCSGTPAHYHNERWYVFNNTVVGVPGGRATGIKWPGCVQASVRNNIFLNVTSGAELRGGCATQVCSVRDDEQRSTDNSVFGPALCWPASSCVRLISGSDVTETGLVTGVQPLMDDDYRLVSGSPGAVDVGTSDPIGQGPGKCLVTSGTTSADCTFDIDGRPRGLGVGWDLGASEALPPAIDPPGTVQGLVRGDKRLP